MLVKKSFRGDTLSRRLLFSVSDWLEDFENVESSQSGLPVHFRLTIPTMLVPNADREFR